MIDRRHFLIGTGALLTASFVRRASAFSRKAGEPLILSPAMKPEETLYVYSQKEWNDHGGEWCVSLGPDQPIAPPAPTWREHLRALARVSRVLRQADLREQLRKARGVDAIMALLVQEARPTAA